MRVEGLTIRFTFEVKRRMFAVAAQQRSVSDLVLQSALQRADEVLSSEGDSHVKWLEGKLQDYEEGKKRRLGKDSVMPKGSSTNNLRGS